ncbi:hypothetical protein AAMO2058_000377200 [Amorphochlora amoebiformis]|uniref:Ribosomal RNA methyltransferase FtsJ domain-containing protein n=1 Tax=Amorphochlora amoebiformis TaxID=1561963 RepID=A0A7S0CX30_9EUKA|mmetsp:Transcript_15313/g.24241  ORF Transcript_15313/g.24241 Transcript_15313/m.24241 type:complete len:407 (+) Transcript_15313:103-1323(+)
MSSSAPVSTKKAKKKRNRKNEEKKMVGNKAPCLRSRKNNENRKIVLNPPERFRPQLILQISTREKERLENHFRNREDLTALGAHVIPTPKEPHLIFLKTSNPTELAKRFKTYFFAARHVRGMFQVENSTVNLPDLKSLLKLESKEGEKKVFKVQVFPNAILQEVLGLLPKDSTHPKKYSHVLHVVQAYWRYHIGVSSGKSTLSKWRVDETPPPPPSLTISRAYFKIAEVISDPANGPFYVKSPENLQKSPKSLGESPRAIDIGASPGGWSSFLASRGFRVLAVDPGELKLSVKIHPFHSNVQHVAKRVLDSKSEMKEQGPFEFIVCDINIPPEESCKKMLEVASLGVLKPGAKLVLTLKMITRQIKSFPKVREAALKLLEHSFKIWKSYHLFSNSHREWTVLGILR